MGDAGAQRGQMAGPGSHSTLPQASVCSQENVQLTSAKTEGDRPAGRLQLEAKPRGPGHAQVVPRTFPGACSLHSELTGPAAAITIIHSSGFLLLLLSLGQQLWRQMLIYPFHR